jgi:O-antigen/teichoic acid export membrane protein
MTTADPSAAPTNLPPDDILDTGAAGGKAIRGGVIRIVGYGIGLLLSLVSVPIMIRHLGKDDYGRYITVSSIIFIIGGITEAGLTNLGVREFSLRRGVERRRFLQSLAGLRFAMTAAGVALAVGLTWVTGAARPVVEGTAIAGVGLFLSLTQQTYAIPLTAELRLGWVTVLDLLKQALLTAAIVAFVVAGAGLLPFFAASILSAAGVLVATLALIRREASLRPRVDRAIWRRVLRDVLPYALAAAVGLIYFRVAVVLLSYIASASETGIYSAAFRIVEVIAVIPWITVSSGFPILARAARDDGDRLRYALQRLFEASTIVGAGIALCIALGAKFAIDVVAGPGFGASVPVLRLLGLALVTSFLVATWSFALLSLRAHRALLICNAIAAAATIGGVLLFEPLLHARGAAIGTVAGEATLALAYLVALRAIRPELVPRMMIVLKVILAAGVGALAAFIPAHPVVVTLVGALGYGVTLMLLRAVPPELFNALRGREPEPSA